MKKKLLALAAMTLCGAATAQSNATLFGNVDTGFQRVSNQGGGSVTRLTNAGISVSHLGVRGSEDLGGGMSASFWVEAGFNSDDGTGRTSNTNNQAAGATGAGGLTFDRRSTVSLSAPWGEIRLGRDFAAAYWNLAVFSAFSTLGVGGTQMARSIITGPTAAWVSNSVGYFLPPKLGGVYGQLQHFRGENLSSAGVTANDGTGSAVRIGYRSGPLDVAAALSRTQRGGPLGDIRQDNAGASWDFGAVKLMGAVGRDKGAVGAVAAEGRSWSLGASVPVGSGEIRLGTSQYTTDLATGASPRSRKVAIGYRHHLSKRTSLYTAYARLSNSGGAAGSIAAGAGAPAANQGSSGFDLGMRHSF